MSLYDGIDLDEAPSPIIQSKPKFLAPNLAVKKAAANEAAKSWKNSGFKLSQSQNALKRANMPSTKVKNIVFPDFSKK